MINLLVNDRKSILSLTGILIITFLIFANSIQNDFLINWDDNLYIIENPDIKEFSLKNIQKYFSSYYVGNYQPLVILSYAIDYKLFGLVQDCQGALDDLSIAIKLSPKSAEAYFKRGLAYLYLKNNDEACLDWKKAADLGHDSAFDNIKRYCN